MTCDCEQFLPIELDRASITRRIKQSSSIREHLAQIAENKDLRIYLFRCPDCGQLWQSGHEWNFADKEYLFQVPSIEVAEWEREPYQQPAAMMIYAAVMRAFFARSKFQTGDSLCRVEGCRQHALRLSAFCLDHHIESIQQIQRLPKKPVGRLFPPYHVESQHMA